MRTEDEIEAEKLETFLHDSIMEMVKKRQDEITNNYGNDFLGSLLKVHHDMDQKNKNICS